MGGERIQMNGVVTTDPDTEDGDVFEAITNAVQNIDQQAEHAGSTTVLRVGYGPKSMQIVTADHHTATDTLLGLRYTCRQTRAETGPLIFAKSTLSAAVSDSRTT